MDVKGKAAIVTGGGTGVGRATALALAKLGCSVFINYSRSQKDAEETASEISALGVKSVALRADVAQDDDCRRMIDTAEKTFGRLDILVNNAGTTSFIPHAELDKVSDDDWDRILSVNLKGAFQCARAARPALERSGSGEIVNVTSVAGITGMGSSIPYCASKAALNVMTISLARVMAPKIRVNAVAPGFIDTRWLRTGLGIAYEPTKEAFAQQTPLGRVCTPEDVSAAILGIITGSDMVTGQVLAVEGGMLFASPALR